MKLKISAVAALVFAGTQAGAVTVSFKNSFPVNQWIEFFGEVSGNDLNTDGMLTLEELSSGYVTFGQTFNYDFQFTQGLGTFTSFSILLTSLFFGDTASEFLTTVYDGGQSFGCGGEPYQIYEAIDYRQNTVNLNYSGYNGRYCLATGGTADFDVGPVSVSTVPLPAGGLMLLTVLPLPLLLRRRRARERLAARST